MKKPRVLVVDDEPQILRFLRPGLTAGDFDVITAATGAEAVKLAATMAPDVIVLDLGLPDKDGKDVIREIRAWSKVPIIVLSARDRESEKIDSLDLGADDYVNKPFGIGELMARIRASLRNRQQTENVTSVFRAGGILIDTLKHVVEKNGNPVHLTPKEFDLMSLLIKNSDRVLRSATASGQWLQNSLGFQYSGEVASRCLTTFRRKSLGKRDMAPAGPRVMIESLINSHMCGSTV